MTQREADFTVSGFRLRVRGPRTDKGKLHSYPKKKGKHDMIKERSISIRLSAILLLFVCSFLITLSPVSNSLLSGYFINEESKSSKSYA